MTDEPTIYGNDVPFGPPSTGPSALDGLLADFTQAQEQHESIELDVPGKPGVSVRFATDIPYESYALWRKGAVDPELGMLNELTFSTSVLVYACRSLRADGEDITDAGQPVTFMTPSLQARLGTSRPADAVRKFYGRDGYVIAIANRIMVAAGYGAQATPTSR